MFTKKIIALIIVILLLMAGRAAAQSQPNATELLKQVAETYQKLKSYQFEVNTHYRDQDGEHRREVRE